MVADKRSTKGVSERVRQHQSAQKVAEIIGERRDLAGADLSGADLRGADLRGTVLDDSNLAGAHLEGANLFKATLDGADLCKCDHSGAQFLYCGQLEAARNWQSAYRDEDLACGAAIPVVADHKTDEPSQR